MSTAPGGRPQEPLLPDNWARLSAQVDRVLDAEPEQRDALISELAAGDPDRQRELAQLVADCLRPSPLLDRPAAEQFGSLARDAAAPMLPEVVADRYRIGRELGRGGMACVYLAHDTKHGRDVAIKVIRPELAFSLGHDRFLREIEIAARLRHPNIVPLYDSGEADGALYFVMPYEEGPSLRARLEADGPLALPDAVAVLRDVARALAYAHEHGVVHRDVKPDNVMLSGDAAVVTDFGIAKAVSAALTNAGQATLTQTGSGIGTPAYMAPEQATGDPGTDHRADLYSLGCLAYEVFTGKPPFHGTSTHEIIAAHLTIDPQPVEELREGIPPAIAELIGRCLEKRADDRPQSAREVLGVLDGGAAGEVSGVRPRRSTAGHRRPVTESPKPGPARWKRAAAATGLVLAATLAGAAVFYAGREAPADAPLSLAVLPFGNIDADSQLTFVAEGLAEEVAAGLSRVPGIQIKSRSGARAYRRKLSPDVSEAGTRLKADYIMTAVVRQDQQGRWIVSAALERAADAASLWSENFTLSPDEQAGAAERIAASLTGALRTQFPRLIGSAPAPAASQRTTNNEAYRLWLRAQEKLSRRGQSLDESADLFRQAIRLDPRYAPAHSGLSMALALFPHFEGVTPESVRDSVISAADRALALDPTLVQPRIALGLMHQFALRWDSAGAEFETAVRLDGHDVEARVQYARHLLFRGRHADALGQLRVARAEDPASALVLSYLGYTFYLMGRPDSALAEARRALENDSTNFTALGFGALIMESAGLIDEARALHARITLYSPSYWYMMAKLDPAAARRQLEGEAPGVLPITENQRALGLLGLGDTARALEALERSTENREIWTSWQMVSDPMFDPIRESARFRALLRRVGLSSHPDARAH